MVGKVGGRERGRCVDVSRLNFKPSHIAISEGSHAAVAIS